MAKKTASEKELKLLDEFRKDEGLSWAELELVLEWIKKPRFSQEPVSVPHFINHPGYMAAEGIIYPQVMKALVEINSGKYVECVLTGPIGTGKTTLALYIIAYQLYLLMCYENPHQVFGLDPASEIVMVFQSVSKKVAQDIEYQRFRAMIEKAPWFKGERGFDSNLESEMNFKNRITVRPVHGGASGAIGSNVIGGILDEMNFMALVEDSKRNPDGNPYDQAVENYNSIAMRRASRFMHQGDLPGMLCLVSSRRYKGQFTDQKEEEAKTNKRIYVYDEKLWTIKPDAFCGDTFQLFVGDNVRSAFIVEEDDVISAEDDHLLMDIPIELIGNFETDMLQALRDIAGLSTMAMHPFVMNVEAVAGCFNRHPSIFSRTKVDFVASQLEILPANIFNHKIPRFVHIDLSFSHDSCGLAIGYVNKFVVMERQGDKETMPNIIIDGILEIAPPKNGEILFSKIRSIIYLLTEMGMKISWVTFDQFQSKDSRQILAQKGYTTGGLSMDRTTMGYEVLKASLYDGRVQAPNHDKCYMEIVSLELDEKKGKIDHRPNGSKDCSDAIAGVVWGLHRRREIWVAHKIPLQEAQKGLGRISERTQKPKVDHKKNVLVMDMQEPHG